MKRYLTIAAILLTVSPLLAAEVGKRHREAAGGFSFCPPQGWTMQNIPGLKYSIAAGPVANGFAPNINVVDEKAGLTLNDYVDTNKKLLAKSFKGYKELGKSEFKTTSGLKATRLITQSDQGGTPIRQTFYFFASKADRKVTVTCSALASNGKALDEAFEASLKTFAIE
jgi:hypothetical protein